MSDRHFTTFQGDVLAALRAAIEEKLPGAAIDVSGGGGHYSIAVTSSAFAGKNTLDRQRLVYAAIGPLMSGDAPPVHAVDSLKTLVP